MAARAYSTPAPASLRPIARVPAVVAEPLPFEGRGCVILDGELITFDAGRRPSINGLALVVRGDGRLAVVPVPEQYTDPHRAVRSGFIMVESDGPRPYGARSCREEVALVGAVLAGS